MAQDLPKRPGSYRITSLRLVVVSHDLIKSLVERVVKLPEPPPGPLTEIQLAEFIRVNLVRTAVAAAHVLQTHEHARITQSYSRLQRLRVEVQVLSGEAIIGRADGGGQAFGPRNNTLTLGDQTPPNLGPRPNSN